MMEAVKQLRAEKEKQKELLNQRSEQRIAIQQADQRQSDTSKSVVIYACIEI